MWIEKEAVMEQAAYDFLTKPFVEVWEGLLKRAEESKRDFNDRGAQIEEFYGGKAGFMWEGSYLDKFMGASRSFKAPKFKVTFNKAFEYTAVMGPLLFWRMAQRKVRPYSSIDYDPQVIAGGDPILLQFMDSLLDQQVSDDARHKLRAAIQERILNHLPKVQPPGGLIAAASMSVHDSLLRGAGFLSTEPYRFPGSERTLVGSFYVRCDDVLIDPDCRSPLWDDAGWMAIRHRNRASDIDAMFGYPRGTMSRHARFVSAGAESTRYPDRGRRSERAQDAHKNVVEWFEIFSRDGTGNNFIGKNKIATEFDDWAGDYAYLCICPKCPWPLNLTAKDLESEDADEEWVRQQLSWPTEYWRNNRWPISKLSFYPQSNRNPWPLPPLSPAIGELTVINILIAAYVQGAYDNRQQLIGVFEGACDELKSVLDSNQSPLPITLKQGIHNSISDALQFINRPEINGDVPRTIEFLLGIVEQRTGMSSMLYGEGGSTNSRSAAEYQGRQQTVNIRPEYMRKCVGDWMSEVAAKELFCVYSHMQTDDVAEMLGPFGTMAWQKLVVEEDVETVLRSSECYVEASDIGRPNHERDAAMLQGMQQYLLPILQGYMAQTGDAEPLNGFIKAVGHATNMDVDGFLIRMPEPDQESNAINQQMQQASSQLEMQKTQAEISKINAEAEQAHAMAQAALLREQNHQQDTTGKIISQQQKAEIDRELQTIKLELAKGKLAAQMQTAEQSQAIRQQDAEHKALIRERDSWLRSTQAELATGLHERDANAKAEAANAQLEAKLAAISADAQMKSQAAMQNLQTAAIKSAQTLEERKAAAHQKLLLEIAGGEQRLNQSDQLHQQQMSVLDDKAQQQAQHSNMIMSQKLLLQAVMADQKRRQQLPEGPMT